MDLDTQTGGQTRTGKDKDTTSVPPPIPRSLNCCFRLDTLRICGPLFNSLSSRPLTESAMLMSDFSSSGCSGCWAQLALEPLGRNGSSLGPRPSSRDQGTRRKKKRDNCAYLLASSRHQTWGRVQEAERRQKRGSVIEGIGGRCDLRSSHSGPSRVAQLKP